MVNNKIKYLDKNEIKRYKIIEDISNLKQSTQKISVIKFDEKKYNNFLFQDDNYFFSEEGLEVIKLLMQQANSSVFFLGTLSKVPRKYKNFTGWFKINYEISYKQYEQFNIDINLNDKIYGNNFIFQEFTDHMIITTPNKAFIIIINFDYEVSIVAFDKSMDSSNYLFTKQLMNEKDLIDNCYFTERNQKNFITLLRKELYNKQL